MKTIILVEEAGQYTECAEVHIFDGDLEQACKLAFDSKIVAWAGSPEEILQAIEQGDGLGSYTVDEISVHKGDYRELF